MAERRREVRHGDPRRSAVGALRLLLAASLLVPASVFATAGWITYRSVVHETIELAGREAEVLKEHAAKVFETAALVLSEIDTSLRGEDDAAARGEEEALHQRLGALIAGLPQFRDAWVIGADARPVASAAIYPVPRDLDLSDRDYFQATRSAAADPYVGDLLSGRSYALRYFSIAAPRRVPGGGPPGAIMLAVVPEYFTSVYRTLFGGSDGIAGIVRADGTMLVREPGLAGPARLSDQSRFMRSIAAAPAGGVYETRSELDGADRLFAYRRLDKVPVYVYAARDRATVLATTVQLMASHLLFGGPATLVLFLVTLLALRRTRAAEAEAARRETAEAALHHAKKMEALGQLTGGVAHDFNNLLMVLSGNLELVKPSVRPEQQKLVATMERALVRAESLTRQLLAFARRKPLRTDRVELAAEMPKILETLQRSLRGDIVLQSEIAADLWPIEADLDELELALINLAVNARDAMPRGGSLGVAAANVPAAEAAALSPPLDGDYVRISVTDTGTGIAAEHLEHVFDPYFTTKPAERGTGLGLSHVHGFATQSGGAALIRSRLGEGTTVELYLPRAVEAPAAAEPPAIPRGTARQAGRERNRVLLVDDNIELGETVRALLVALGYRVRHAVGAGEAFAALATEPADIVVTDIVMPGMDGIELARRLRRDRPGLPILLVTGYSGAVAEGRAAGFPLLTKPYRGDQLDRAIQELIGAPAARDTEAAPLAG